MDVITQMDENININERENIIIKNAIIESLNKDIKHYGDFQKNAISIYMKLKKNYQIMYPRPVKDQM